MRKLGQALAVFAGGFLVVVGGFTVIYLVVGHYGFNSQITPYYGFTSGPGPMFLTAFGMSTIIAGLWHTMNCHEAGCWNLGRHRVNGTPWCNTHHEQARAEITDSMRLDALVAGQAQTNRLLTDLLRGPE